MRERRAEPHVEVQRDVDSPLGKDLAQTPQLRKALEPRDPIIDPRVSLDAQSRRDVLCCEVTQCSYCRLPGRRALLKTPVHALAAALGMHDDLAERGAGVLLKVALHEDEASLLSRRSGVREVRQAVAHTRGRGTGGRREVVLELASCAR